MLPVWSTGRPLAPPERLSPSLAAPGGLLLLESYWVGQLMYDMWSSTVVI